MLTAVVYHGWRQYHFSRSSRCIGEPFAKRFVRVAVTIRLVDSGCIDLIPTLLITTAVQRYQSHPIPDQRWDYTLIQHLLSLAATL